MTGTLTESVTAATASPSSLANDVSLRDILFSPFALDFL
jgi:hypothetical protein